MTTTRTSLAAARNLLVGRWGEMGGYWGINRTMAEIHALLFVTAEPLCTDDIMSQLQISRGNASMNLRGLVDWGLIRRVHKLGDRKEYFEADTDVWHMFETIMRERRRREVEPIVATIDRCIEMVTADAAEAEPHEAAQRAESLRRLEELRGFLTAMGSLFELVVHLGKDVVTQLPQLVRPPGPAPTPAAAPRAANGNSARARRAPRRTNRARA